MPRLLALDRGGRHLDADLEGPAYFDVAWDPRVVADALRRHVLGIAPGDARPPSARGLPGAYRYAQVLSPVEAPLRIAQTDFPDRRWMRDPAKRNIAKALASL
ncbi:hypothetical protein ACNTMW_09435 [Planosporangium sp. 12N6]|uniref:hypothetical protein n=1 Tax=Planosporangium spinosum TaxID=3402278 RepID=UPI003CF8C022